MRTKHFFDNIGYILFFGIFGTLTTFLIICTFAGLLVEFDFIIKNKPRFSEILLLSCVLTSTDTVAALSLVKEKHYPKLNSILFGEGF